MTGSVSCDLFNKEGTAHFLVMSGFTLRKNAPTLGKSTAMTSNKEVVVISLTADVNNSKVFFYGFNSVIGNTASQSPRLAWT